MLVMMLILRLVFYRPSRQTLAGNRVVWSLVVVVVYGGEGGGGVGIEVVE